MSEPSLDDLFTWAFAAFDANDVSVADALRHLTGELPHLALLELRRAGAEQAASEARALLGEAPPAALEEAFVAGPLSHAGCHEEALRTRLGLLPRVARWEGELACHVLGAIARDALALGRAGHAVTAARRALRFSPLDPRTLAVLADALLAAGEAGEAASVRAHLWDAGYDADVIAGVPTAEDRVAEAWAPDLTALEPMTVEDRARFAVLSLNDSAHVETLNGVARHAVMQLRSGHFSQAYATLTALRAWEPQSSAALRWLAMEGDSDARDRMRALLLDAILATPAGAAAASAAKKKAPNPASPLIVTRRQGVADAPPELVEPALTDNYIGVRLAARLRLADHPLVARAAAIEAATPGLARLYGGDAPEVWSQAQVLVGSWDPDRQWTRPVDQRVRPALDAGAPSDDGPGGGPPYSFIEPARAAKPVCKTCKEVFVVGEAQLRVRGDYDVLAKAAPHHPRCATKGKLRAVRDAAVARWRHPIPGVES